MSANQRTVAEIRGAAVEFAAKWKGVSSEHAEAKSFWDDFFSVFGISRRRVATFEEPVKKQDGRHGRIDLLWKGVLLVEHKSEGKDLDSAFGQAKDYFPGLKDRDLPRYVVVSDFARFRLHDLDTAQEHEFTLDALHHYIHLFGFMTGRQVREFGKQDPVNVKAVERLGDLHDQMKATGYTGEDLESFLIRILFCLFAEDNGIFEKNAFRDLIERRSAEDGSDLDGLFTKLFYVLDTPGDKRLKNLPEDLAELPYVNGSLFARSLAPAQFDARMREALLDCTALDWSKISPAIFGSLFQSVMDEKKRREFGAHYTSEANILKALSPLFLDDLRAELESINRDRRKLYDFHQRLATIRVLDPACGCGNFLVVAYRELRLIELDVLRLLWKDATNKQGGMLDVDTAVLTNVDQFYGIEVDPFPSHIAQISLWLMDHQMNMRVSAEFGQYFVRIPLRKAPTIACANALTIDWASVIVPENCTYVVGNPPFVGAKFMSDTQRQETRAVFGGMKNAGLLDYVTAWYVKAAHYMESAPESRQPRCAFVSTNSITQGEQVAPLWGWMLAKGVKIHFAHRTFAWGSEARGKAAVHCVIVGFGMSDVLNKVLYEYENGKGDPVVTKAANINPYLVDAPDAILENRGKPLMTGSVTMRSGNKPIDDGNYLFTPTERQDFLQREPEAARFFKRWCGSEEFINDIERWCLWLGDASPAEIKALPLCRQRIENVRKFRAASSSGPTQKLAATPTRFHTEFLPGKPFLAIPQVSSERRAYVPMAFLDPASFLAGDKLRVVADADLYAFGVLTSSMHMAWMRSVCGRLKSDYQYSAKIVFNNFPWPEPSDKQHAAIEQSAQGVLDARAQFPDSSLADLYDPLTMPPALVKAHQALDRAVDAAYGRTKFANEGERVAFLFSLYQKLTAPLDTQAATKPKRGRATKPASADA